MILALKNGFSIEKISNSTAMLYVSMKYCCNYYLFTVGNKDPMFVDEVLALLNGFDVDEVTGMTIHEYKTLKSDGKTLARIRKFNGIL